MKDKNVTFIYTRIQEYNLKIRNLYRIYTITALDFNKGNCDIIKSSISHTFLKT